MNTKDNSRFTAADIEAVVGLIGENMPQHVGATATDIKELLQSLQDTRDQRDKMATALRNIDEIGDYLLCYIRTSRPKTSTLVALFQKHLDTVRSTLYNNKHHRGAESSDSARENLLIIAADPELLAACKRALQLLKESGFRSGGAMHELQDAIYRADDAHS